jgi:hypothetical protein
MAQAVVYWKVTGKSGNTWYIPKTSTPATSLHVDTHNPHSEGYAGSFLSFEMEDGTVDKVKGPWHSNSDALYDDTGVDVRNTYPTRVILARNRVFGDGGLRATFQDVFYLEETPILGRYNRYLSVIDRFFQGNPEWNGMVFYYMDSNGGSSSGGMERNSPSLLRYKEGYNG